MTTTMLEKECQEELFKMGNTAILEKEKDPLPNGNWLTCLDLTLNKERADIASITGNGYYGWQLYNKNKQIKKWNERPDVTEPSESVILYFHDPTMFSDEKMQESIPFYKNKIVENHKQQLIKHIYCVIKGASNIITYDI